MFWVVARSFHGPVLHHRKSMGATLGRSCPQGCNFNPILRYGLPEPASLFKCGKISHFCEIHSLSYEASKFFAMLSLCVFFGRYFAPGVNIVPPIAYKSHSTPFPIKAARFDTSFMALWQKTAERVARRSLVRANSNYNTRMYISRRKCEWCLQWQKTPPGC